ncbi:MAG: leucyl/phenylalanyl-tRNA--protein transferase [Armatimonadetes bacterium]|nr:leucyl/phenylalanyl-tRNA--protein transferase [Armatimonadota bacterium]
MFRVIDPRRAGDLEVVGLGGDLSVGSLLWAYRRGIFPWPTPGYPLLWFCPPRRAILDFAHLHVPRRLARLRRRAPLTFTIDRAFPQVIAACRQAPRPGQNGTWITPGLLRAYVAFHEAGHAHSVEAWDEDGALVGGLYGVSVDGCFAGESMFHRAPNASKLALLHLIDHLRARGLDWLDIQMMTPHMAALGATEIPRDEFLDRLDATCARGLTLFD